VQAAKLGAKIVPIAPGYLSVVQARAREYCAQKGARLAPFGVDMSEAIKVIAAAARTCELEPDEVWCAASSGVLSRGLAAAWSKAPASFSREACGRPPFPSDPHYESKAWELAIVRKRVRTGGLLERGGARIFISRMKHVRMKKQKWSPYFPPITILRSAKCLQAHSIAARPVHVSCSTPSHLPKLSQ
jgi:hypothetical protein